jgi:4,5-DOPA dioxygenase extradiol
VCRYGPPVIEPADSPAAGLGTAQPHTEHSAPLFVTLGAGENDLSVLRQPIEGFWGGLAKRSVQLG